MGKTQPASAGYQVSLLSLGSYIRVYQDVMLDLTMQSSTEMPDRVETCVLRGKGETFNI